MARPGKGAGRAARGAVSARPVGAEEIRALYGAVPQDISGEGEPSYRGPPGRGRGGRKARPGGRGAESRGLRLLTRILGGIAGALFLLILGGTFYAMFRDPPGEAPGGSGGFSPGEIPGAYPRSAVFTGIGRLRIQAGAGSPQGGAGADPLSRAVVVLSVVFPYPPEDRPFTEELAGKIPLFRRIIRDYFGALSPDELAPLDEQGAKEELLRRFNGELQLGKIESLLFNDLMILE